MVQPSTLHAVRALARVIRAFILTVGTFLAANAAIKWIFT